MNNVEICVVGYIQTLCCSNGLSLNYNNYDFETDLKIFINSRI